MSPALRPVLIRWLAGPAAVLGAFLLTACGGGSGQAVDPRIASADATRDLVDSAPAVTSTLRVRFNVAVDPPNDDLPLASYFEVRIPDAFEKNPDARAFVSDAEVVKGNTRTVDLRFDRLIPEDAELRVSLSLFRKGASGEITASVDSDLSPIQAVLASGPLGIGDFSLIENAVTRPATSSDRDAAAMRASLERHLEARGAAADLRDLALARYDGMPTGVVPSPKLRAVLAALSGTFAEPALENLLTANNCTGMPVARILFQDPPDEPGLVARVTHDAGGARVISVSPRLEGEPLELLMPILAHEAIHCDLDDSVVEEVAATSFDTLLYLQVLTAVPDVVRWGSQLARELNVDAIAMINSGRAIPESVGVLPSPAVREALPGSSSSVSSFAELIASAYEGLPGLSEPEPLAKLYAGILAGFAGLPAKEPFDLTYLDGLVGSSLSPEVLLYALSVLGLQPLD